MVKRLTAVGAALLLVAGCTDTATEPGSPDLSLDESTTDSSAGPIETTGVSAAQTVQYDQPWPGEFTAGFISLTGASRWQMADNFTPTADWNVTELEWVGVYVPPTGGVASPRSFVIEFFDDVDGEPDATAFHTETVTATLTTTGVRAGFNEVFDHTGASLGSPISFSAGVTYWLSIMDDDPSASQRDGFFWSTTLTGDGIVQRFDKRDWSTVLNRDLAFTLIGGAITDDTPPVITVDVDGDPGENGWYTSDITVSWGVTDAESPVTEPSGCDPSTVMSDTNEVTFTCSATSVGGTASASVTVKRDATPPTVTYTGNDSPYAVSDNVGITCTATDDLSGLASDNCAYVGGPAWSFGLGTTNFSAMATDNAGLVGEGFTSFDVTASFDGLCELVESFVSHAGVANSMCANIRAAGRADARGRTVARDNVLSAFINEVEAQTGKRVDADDAAVLIVIATALMS